MTGRTWVRLPYVFGLVLALGLSAMTEAKAQSKTDEVVECIDNAADELKKCVDDLKWYQEALCYARYASDGILCAPSIALKAL